MGWDLGCAHTPRVKTKPDRASRTPFQAGQARARRPAVVAATPPTDKAVVAPAVAAMPVTRGRARTMSEPSREQVEACARALWLLRGRPYDQDVPIWLEAEHRLRHPERGPFAPEHGLPEPLFDSADVMRELDDRFSVQPDTVSTAL